MAPRHAQSIPAGARGKANLRTVNHFRILCRAVFCCCVAAVLYLALAPHTPAHPLTAWDKANHVLAFATMALWGAAGWPAHLARVLAGLLGYGVLIEVLQAFTPTRSGDLRDVVADVVGLALAGGIVQALRWRRTRRARA